MSNSSVHIVKTGVESISLISALARTIWHQHYPGIISAEQIDYMLGKMYSAESLAGQVNEQKHSFYLVKQNDNTIGFISISEQENSIFFIHKFYILQNLSANGIGTEALHQLIKELQPKEMRLTVNRQNFKSVNFYFKNGFKIERVADFDIGNGFVMNDFVMVWKIS